MVDSSMNNKLMDYQPLICCKFLIDNYGHFSVSMGHVYTCVKFSVCCIVTNVAPQKKNTEHRNTIVVHIMDHEGLGFLVKPLKLASQFLYDILTESVRYSQTQSVFRVQ